MQHFTEAIIKIFTVQLLRYLILAGIAYLVVYVLLNKKLANAKIQKRSAVKADYVREVLYSVQSAFILSVVGYILIATPFFGHYVHIYRDINQYGMWWLCGSIFVSLILQDTYFYWMHVILHHKWWFKFTHLVHHKSVNPSPWTAYSFHFVEAWAEGGVLVFIALIIPVHPYALFLFTVASLILNVYLHLGYEIMPRWFRRSFLFGHLNTSVFHNLHHSKFKGNYGLYFRYWDLLMKTEHPDYVKVYDKVQEARFAGKKQPSPTTHYIEQVDEHQPQG